jgi:hypothetical protein
MQTISEVEKRARLEAVGSVVGTHAMEGIRLDATVELLMNRYAEGELSLEQFSVAMDAHAQATLAKHRELAGAA